MHDIAIALHAAAAAAALLAALVALSFGRLRRAHLAAVALMTAALVPAVWLSWNDTDPVLRWVFVGLIGLAAVMTGLAVRAMRVPLVAGRVGPAHVDLIGFNVIALVDGFAIVAALRGGWPGWAVFAIGAGVIVAGHVSLRVGRARASRRQARLGEISSSPAIVSLAS